MARGLFNQSAALIYPAERESYLNNTVKSDTSAMPGYSPAQEGYLSILGKTLSGVGAAFAGDTQWGQRQQKMDQEMMQADLEFKAALQKQYQDMQDKMQSKRQLTPQNQIDTLSATRKLAEQQGIDPSSLGISVGSTGVPSLQMYSPNRQNASMQGYKNKLTESVISTFNQSQDTRSMADTALSSIKNLESGLKGKVTYNVIKNLDANNPLLGDWQNLKMALTNAQLQASGPLKGAISDAENKWLAQAAANDDLISVPRATAVLNQLKRAADTKEKSVVNSYKRIYKDDPYSWEELKGASQDKQKNQSGSVDPRYQQAIKAGYTKEEIDAYLKGKK